ncbi:hypothetical protein JQ615_18360 [Bradyrhizobium jicamae]|uniref:Transcriptional regulator n=1 Tax=Bradyrhizobium jicamae TaxID=280332 RepID=A0ABS5FKN8_9BRAD|nr:hypothetical protein [Bradyrhizobium jicamae]MBR0797354.1 hypothetical protein [Bradyrhizobium jicamae]
MRIGDEAVQDWHDALNSYAKRHGLTRSAATMEFASTTEARTIYKRIARQPRSAAVSKAAATANVSIETLAAQAFPDDPAPTAISKYLATPEGAEDYNAFTLAKTRAEQGI